MYLLYYYCDNFFAIDFIGLFNKIKQNNYIEFNFYRKVKKKKIKNYYNNNYKYVKRWFMFDNNDYYLLQYLPTKNYNLNIVLNKKVVRY